LDSSTADSSKRKVYFASDFHLGIPSHDESLKREKMLVSWLSRIQPDASEIFLMGDVFDFWFEYSTVIPKGYVRLLGKLAEITDAGIPVHLFRGNHDIWAFNYLNREVNIQIHRKPMIREFNGKRIYLAHGDGLGPGDHGYKFLKRVFECRLCQWLFRWLHPDIGARMALYFSRKSRLANILKEGKKDRANGDFHDEMLYKYATDLVNSGLDVDYMIFGHRHLPLNEPVSENTRIIILGDWLTNFSYAYFDGTEVRTAFFTMD
jgi:UDP-2,3-diacylglucosamine hydrolase